MASDAPTQEELDAAFACRECGLIACQCLYSREIRALQQQREDSMLLARQPEPKAEESTDG